MQEIISPKKRIGKQKYKIHQPRNTSISRHNDVHIEGFKELWQKDEDNPKEKERRTKPKQNLFKPITTKATDK